MSNFLENLPDLGMGRSARRKKKRKKTTVKREYAAVLYIKPKCPRCKSDKVPVYNTNHLPIRYHKCADCGLLFKSVEKEV